MKMALESSFRRVFVGVVIAWLDLLVRLSGAKGT